MREYNAALPSCVCRSSPRVPLGGAVGAARRPPRAPVAWEGMIAGKILIERRARSSGADARTSAVLLGRERPCAIMDMLFLAPCGTAAGRAARSNWIIDELCHMISGQLRGRAYPNVFLWHVLIGRMRALAYQIYCSRMFPYFSRIRLNYFGDTYGVLGSTSGHNLWSFQKCFKKYCNRSGIIN